ncbi:MAG: hypothetical protein AAFU53_09745 [Cyanobacteria bacterium J06632_3]
MKPDSSPADNDNSPSVESSTPKQARSQPNKQDPAAAAGSVPAANASANASAASPVEILQRRYSDQLSEEIERLEAQKSQLQSEIIALRQDYASLHAQAQRLRRNNNLATGRPLVTGAPLVSQHIQQRQPSPSTAPATPDTPASNATNTNATNSEALSHNTAETASVETARTERVPPFIGPRLPGEPDVTEIEDTGRPQTEPTLSTPSAIRERSLELPTPATSEQRRWQESVKKEASATISVRRRSSKKGLLLSAIATTLIAAHYGLISVLSEGGSWLGLSIGAMGTGFLPAVAILWLRMLVMIPLLVLFAPQLYADTWEDLQDWIQTREQLLIRLVFSGIALFFSQVLLYQSIGIAGPAIGAALLFLYPLTAIPLGLFLKQERALTPFGLLALVAIVMGGLLVIRPMLTTMTTALWLGLLASLALSLYIVLTNLSYRQQCHPIPAAVIQFSTVAVASSIVLLFRPLQLADISWMSFFIWGLVVGMLMLVAYLFNYSSLRSIGPRTAIIAAATPLVALAFTAVLQPTQKLEIIQFTGIALVSIGGIALGKEKLSRPS